MRLKQTGGVGEPFDSISFAFAEGGAFCELEARPLRMAPRYRSSVDSAMQKPTKATVEIQWNGRVWRGVVVGGLGVLTSDKGSTYAGGVAGGTFDGRGVVKWPSGRTDYCELAAGEDHGYREVHHADGTVVYYLSERGKIVHSAIVCADGDCVYDYKSCGADHAGHVALKTAAQQATVRTATAPAARHPTALPWGFVRVVRARVPRSAVACSH